MKKLIPTIFFLFFVIPLVEAVSPLESKKQRMEKFEANRPKPQEFHEKMLQAYHKSSWNKVIQEASGLKTNYPDSPLTSDAYFYAGVAYFHTGELELANKSFSDYLRLSQNLRHFEQAVQYKFQIAKLYESGMKKRLFGMKKMPKILPAKDEALTVFDEVVAALPRSDLACESLYKKAGLLVHFEDLKEAIDTYQTLIRRFPKNPLAAKSYQAIADVYLMQAKTEFPDPALVELAEINLKRFQTDFPKDPLVRDIQEKLNEMKGVFAEELYTVGNYFIKKKKYQAAFIYFKTIVSRYSDTRYRDLAFKQIDVIKKRSGTPHEFEL